MERRGWNPSDDQSPKPGVGGNLGLFLEKALLKLGGKHLLQPKSRKP